MNRTVVSVAASAFVVALASWSTYALAVPSGTSTRLQLAEDQQANCQLLANNSSGTQRTRALQCVTDQQRIIQLLTTPSPSPSPTPTGDTQPPSIPTGLVATIRANLDILVTWNASTDNVGVVDYLFERGTTQLGVTTTPDWLDTGRSPGTTYTYRVRARDAAGNISGYSNTLTVTTPNPTGPVLNCRNRLSDPVCGYPDATNTGPIPGTIFTTLSGNQSFNTQGQVVENVVINGCVEVHANNVTIRNSIINANGCFYGVRNFATSLNLNFVEITCGGFNGTGVTATDYTVVGANIHNCENGYNVGGNVVVRDTYVHDMETDNGAHTDGAQFNQGAANILFAHNTLITPTPGGTAAIIMWDEVNPQNSNVTIQDNFLIGGTYTLYCPRMNATNIVIINNRFGEFEFGNVNSCVPGHVTTFTGNFQDSTGNPPQE